MPKTTLPTRVRHQAASVPAPQLLRSAEQGYTCVPNDFFDRVAPGLKESELRVMLYIYRHTFGFHKVADYISYDQFQHGIVSKKDGRRLDLGAGVSRRALVTALAALEAKGLITRDHTTGHHAPARYAPVIHQTDNHTVDNQADQVQNDHSAGADKMIETHPAGAYRVQDLHSTKQIESHDNMKDSSRATAAVVVPLDELVVDEGGRSEDEVSVSKAVQFDQSVQLMRENIPGLTVKDARRLANIALNQHRRDPDYLARLVEHVTTSPAIRVPAAVLTTLVQTNTERTLPLPASTPDHFREGRKMVKPPAPNAQYNFTKFAPGGKYAFLVAPVSDG